MCVELESGLMRPARRQHDGTLTDVGGALVREQNGRPEAVP